MSLGSFGSIVFEVSSSAVRTFDNLSRELSAKFVEHDVLNSKPVLQHVGTALTTISFTMYFNAFNGVNPEKELAALEAILNTGTEQPLFIGSKNFGKFVLEKISESRKVVGGKGELLTAEAAVTLKEYYAPIVKTAKKTQSKKTVKKQTEAEYVDLWRYKK
ncbi:phage tail protein [Geovibrio ferrireducens]|uniref:phage tail protein n=1 Tax=Geovibrio ferrireducens TaxID=46201 RepID=UPI00224748B4|nr:phage tail protein [Geovibrio ferrireducens]